MQRAVTAVRTWESGVWLGPRVTPLQLRGDGVGEVGLDFVDMADDAAGVQLVAAQGGYFRHCLNVIREGEDRRLHGIDDRFGGRAGVQRRAKPIETGVVGEQQIVLGPEVAVERAQRNTGVGRDLLGRRVLDALGQESHHRGLAQRLARAPAACRLGGPDHGSKVPQTKSPQVLTILTKLPVEGETAPMVSLLVHVLLGLGCIAWIVAANPKVFAKPAGRGMSLAAGMRVLRRRHRIGRAGLVVQHPLRDGTRMGRET